MRRDGPSVRTKGVIVIPDASFDARIHNLFSTTGHTMESAAPFFYFAFCFFLSHNQEFRLPQTRARHTLETCLSRVAVTGRQGVIKNFPRLKREQAKPTLFSRGPPRPDLIQPQLN